MKLNIEKEKKSMRRKTCVFFIVLMMISLFFMYALNLVQEKEAKMTARYTAEDTIRKIETQIGRYMENSDLLKNMISSGKTLSDTEFSELASAMIKNKKVVEAYELAKDGIVEQVYPIEGNEEAFGLDMLHLPERKTEAQLAKDTKTYTIAGPYELKQGGMGALIFDPIYLDDAFWGFSITVINWEEFLNELQLDTLHEAGYDFVVWKQDASGKRISILEGTDKVGKDALTVKCNVPNDVWYFAIAKHGGWISFHEKLQGVLISFIIAILSSIWYWQKSMRHLQEEEYAYNLNEAVKQANMANASKSRFLFNMSHDIRTPMNAIIGYTDLLQDHLDDKEKAKDYITKIQSANSMLLSLVNYILEMARIESGKIELRLENGNIEKLFSTLQSVVDPLMMQKNIQANWNCDITHKDIVCDITKVREILLNIVSNAIKYTNENGSVTIDCKEIACEKQGYAKYHFKIADTGIGMSEAYLPHIFEEFSREHTTTESRVVGAGLGLPIVKSLVDLMDGTIEVKSKVNKGTTFIVDLAFPLAAKVQESRQVDYYDKKYERLIGKRVLLVEDNALNTEIAKEILQKIGLVVDCATNGKECINQLETCEDGYYDAIFMDIQMPIMDGYETTKCIREGKKNKKIPIIAMTANAFAEDQAKALQCGMDAHIAKPISIDKIRDTLIDVIQK